MAKSHRPKRIGEEIRKIISSMLLKDLKDPRLEGMISISGVDVTRDGSYATCFVTVLDLTGKEDEKEEKERQVLEGLTSAAGMIRTEIGKELKLRHVPELIFRMDHSMEYGRHIDEVIRGLDIKHDEEE